MGFEGEEKFNDDTQIFFVGNEWNPFNVFLGCLTTSKMVGEKVSSWTPTRLPKKAPSMEVADRAVAEEEERKRRRREKGLTAIPEARDSTS